MMKEKISEIISQIDEEYVYEATDYVKMKSKPFFEWLKGKFWIVGLVVIIIISVRLFPILWKGDDVKEIPKLVICTDSETYELVKGAVSRWRALGREYSTSVQVEVIRISGVQESAEIKIQEIKTELMAGKGPDLFVLASEDPYARVDNREVHMLFKNPEKAMYSEIFLPLDEYLKTAEFIQTEDCHPVVMQAGQTEEGQLLLPMIYEYHICIFPDEISQDPLEFPKSWEDVISSDTMGAALRSQRPYSLPQAFGLLADFKNDTLLVSQEALLEEVKMACLEERVWKRNVGAISATPSMLWSLYNDEMAFLKFLIPGYSSEEEGAYSTYPIPNTDGGVTACISVYAGINRNTEVEKEAFSLLDTVYDLIEVNSAFAERGLFIEQGEATLHNYKYKYRMSEEQIQSLLEMNEKITTARFYSEWDKRLVDIFEEYGGEYDSFASFVEASVRYLYNDMLMQVKE